MTQSAEGKREISAKIIQPSVVSAENGSRILGRIITFLLLFVTWVVLSGRFDFFHLALGVLSCILVTVFSEDLLFPQGFHVHTIDTWFRLLRYFPWLIFQIFLSSVHVLKLVFHPRMLELLDPQIITFDTQIDDYVGRVTFANSITLTPGTITVYLSIYGYLRVHAIDSASAAGLSGEMEQRIKKVFDQ